MAKGDRVRLDATSNIYSESTGNKLVYVYDLSLDQNGQPLANPVDGCVMIECKGGITNGSYGFIDGDPVKISKIALKDYSGSPGLHGIDTTILIPVFLEQYQRRGWFPVDNVRIVAGGVPSLKSVTPKTQL